jgi:hypothetical protein
MTDPTAPLLIPWDNFYVIVGSSGAALTGLQFVVMALVADRRRASTPAAVAAYGTPTIVHFCAVLTMAGAITMPFPTITGPALILGLGGLAGLAYIAIVTRRARSQTGYKPVLEDWIWHIVLPFVAYGTLLVSAIALHRGVGVALFPVAAVALLLLFIGIHNSWDTVTYIAIEQPSEPAPEVDPAKR